MEITSLAIDLAKQLFELCGADSSGTPRLRRRLRRSQLLGFMRNHPVCEVGRGLAVERITGRASLPRWDIE
jgi:transposase